MVGKKVSVSGYTTKDGKKVNGYTKNISKSSNPNASFPGTRPPSQNVNTKPPHPIKKDDPPFPPGGGSAGVAVGGAWERYNETQAGRHLKYEMGNALDNTVPQLDTTVPKTVHRFFKNQPKYAEGEQIYVGQIYNETHGWQSLPKPLPANPENMQKLSRMGSTRASLYSENVALSDFNMSELL